MAAVGPKPDDPFAIFKEALKFCADSRNVEKSWQNSFVKIQNNPQVLQKAYSNYRNDVINYFNIIKSGVEDLSKSLNEPEVQDLKKIVKKFEPDVQKAATAQEGQQLNACINQLRNKIEDIIEERDLLQQYRQPPSPQHLPPIEEEMEGQSPQSQSPSQ
jgi:hypothetical protein